MSAVEDYLTYLTRQRNRSANTVSTYRRTLRSLAEAVGDPLVATRQDVEAWWEARARLAAASRVNELAAVRGFYKWAVRWEHREDDPTLRIDAPSLPQGLPHPMSRADFHELLSKLSDELRRAVALGGYAGLRISEVAALDWADLDPEARRIRVTGKGRKVRMVGLPTLLLDHLLPDTGGNVVTACGFVYSGAALQRKVNRAIHAAGVDGTFHALRHRYVTMALAGTGNLLAVSRAVGHSSLATTSIYAALADSDLDLVAEAATR
jgi:site-specific recombinase XerD